MRQRLGISDAEEEDPRTHWRGASMLKYRVIVFIPVIERRSTHEASDIVRRIQSRRVIEPCLRKLGPVLS
jgi:hypothetical protein